MIKYEKKENDFLISIFPRLDATNVEETENEINKVLEEAHEGVIVDLENLAYISSAGLRLMLKLKKAHTKFQIINASVEVYDVFDMTGFAEIMDISKAHRKFDVEGCKVIGEGAKGIVYRYDADTIIKVYKKNDAIAEVEREKNLAKRAFVLGVPTAISYDIIKVGDKYASMFELLDSKSLTEMIKDDMDNIDKYVAIYANLLKSIHEIQVNDDIIPPADAIITKWLDDFKKGLDEDNYNKLEKYINSIPATNNLLHMDFHTNNIMMQNNEAILIDMDTLSYGNPVYELGNIYATYVGFSMISAATIENFMHLDLATTKYMYDKFIRMYYNDLNEEEFIKKSNEAKLVGLIRVLRHTIRRADSISNANEIKKQCLEQINELLKGE